MALLAFSLQSTAAPVTLEQAQNEAKDFLQSIGAQVGSITLVEAPAKDSSDGEVYYYLFNYGDDAGFVIISGDDRTQSVLAYSDQGHVSENDIQNTFRPMLESYKVDLDDVARQTQTEEIGERPRHVQSPSYSPVAPMLTCHWTQIDPYNSKCPTVGGKVSPAGCLPVAVAQVMYAFRDRMPTKLPVAIPAYSTKTYKKSMSAVAKGTAFNWGSMVDGLLNASSTQISAVANLLIYVGKALKADYQPEKTNAPWNNVPDVMNTYFGFASGIQLLKKSAYTDDRWKQLMAQELMANRPVIMYGENYNDEAHAFVVDGFDGGEMYHVNWGWGRGNGYFLLSVLNPLQPNDEDALISSQKSFNKNLQAYIGIQPVQGYTQPAEDITLMSTINSASSSLAKVTFKNTTSKTQKYTAGLGYYDDNKRVHLLKKWSLGKKSMAAGTSVSGVEFTIAKTDFTSVSLPTGTYQLYPIYMADGDDDWHVCDQSSTYSYVKAVYKSTGVTLSKEKPTPSYVVTDLNFPGSHGKDYDQYVTFNVKNEGDDGVGTLYLYASTTSTSFGSSRSKVDLPLNSGESASVQMQFTPTSAKTYYVWITDGTNVLKKATVTITSLASTSVYALATSGYSIENLKEGSSTAFYGNTLKGTVTIKNNGSHAYAGFVSVYLYKLSGNAYVSTLERKEHYLELKAGAKTTIDFCFENLKYGQKYGLFPLYEDTRQFVKPLQMSLVGSMGVIFYTADGKTTASAATSSVTVPSNVVAVDVSGVASSVSKVVPNSNPNTLYLMNSSESAPSGLSGKNIVKGDKATSISLTDGYEFYVPRRFTATDITFTRKPSIGTNGSGGWTSIVMPFDVDKVTVNDELLDWFKSDTDYGKNFWVKEFQGISGQNTVCFGYAQEMKANNPYIMAVPGDKWGAKYSLVGKKIVFHGTNAQLEKDPSILVGSDLMYFRGTYATLNTTSTYVLNSTGTKFSFGSNTVKPFCGFFVAKDLDVFGVGDLNIGTFEDDTDGIMTLFETSENGTVDVYNVSGVKVGTAEVENGTVNLGNLPRGVYIVNGKKIMK
ncbi:MAG: C10 family peptidase [Prevotella sp.]|nr:C10 family peptidase [Prevotella sp.]